MLFLTIFLYVKQPFCYLLYFIIHWYHATIIRPEFVNSELSLKRSISLESHL